MTLTFQTDGRLVDPRPIRRDLTGEPDPARFAACLGRPIDIQPGVTLVAMLRALAPYAEIVAALSGQRLGDWLALADSLPDIPDADRVIARTAGCSRIALTGAVMIDWTGTPEAPHVYTAWEAYGLTPEGAPAALDLADIHPVLLLGLPVVHLAGEICEEDRPGRTSDLSPVLAHDGDTARTVSRRAAVEATLGASVLQGLLNALPGEVPRATPARAPETPRATAKAA